MTSSCPNAPSCGPADGEALPRVHVLSTEVGDLRGPGPREPEQLQEGPERGPGVSAESGSGRRVDEACRPLAFLLRLADTCERAAAGEAPPLRPPEALPGDARQFALKCRTTACRGRSPRYRPALTPSGRTAGELLSEAPAVEPISPQTDGRHPPFAVSQEAGDDLAHGGPLHFPGLRLRRAAGLRPPRLRAGHLLWRLSLSPGHQPVPRLDGLGLVVLP